MATSPLNRASKALARALSVCPPNHPLSNSLLTLSNPLTYLASYTTLDQPIWHPTLNSLTIFAHQTFDALNSLSSLNTNHSQRQAQLSALHDRALAIHRHLDLTGFHTAFFPFHLHIRTLLALSSVIDHHTDISTHLQHIQRSLPTIYICLQHIFQSSPSSINPTAAFRHVTSNHRPFTPPAAHNLAPVPAPHQFTNLHNAYHAFIKKLDRLPNFPHRVKPIITFVNALWIQPTIDLKYIRLENSQSSLGLSPRLGTSLNTNVEPALLAITNRSKHLWTTRIALKSIPIYNYTPRCKALFRQEALRLNTFSHPCLPVMYGSFWPSEPTHSSAAPPDAVLATERMTHSLRQGLSDPAFTSFETRLKVLCDIADALQYLHLQQVVHAALSPDNVHVRLDEHKLHGHAKLDVTSLAVRAIDPHLSKRPCIYNAPEQVLASQQLYYTADVWSFAVLACFLLAKQECDFEDNLRYVHTVATHGKCYQAQQWAMNISHPRLKILVQSCLVEDPTRRLTALQVHETLSEILKNKTVEADTDVPLTPAVCVNQVDKSEPMRNKQAPQTTDTPRQRQPEVSADPGRHDSYSDDDSDALPDLMDNSPDNANDRMRLAHQSRKESSTGTSKLSPGKSISKKRPSIVADPSHPFRLKQSSIPGPVNKIVSKRPSANNSESPEAISDEVDNKESVKRKPTALLKATMEEIFGPSSPYKGKRTVKQEPRTKDAVPVPQGTHQETNAVDPPSAESVVTSSHNNAAKQKIAPSQQPSKQKEEPLLEVDEITPNEREYAPVLDEGGCETRKRRAVSPLKESDGDETFHMPKRTRTRGKSSVWEGRIRKRTAKVTPSQYAEIVTVNNSSSAASSCDEQLSNSSRPPESNSSVLSVRNDVSKPLSKSGKKRSNSPKEKMSLYEDEKEHNRLRASFSNLHRSNRETSLEADDMEYRKKHRPGETPLQYYIREAQGGNTNAQVKIGIMYEEGKNVDRNYAQACYYYQQAAMAGNSDGQTRLAQCYQAGRGVTADQPAAARLFSKAAKSGHMKAQLLGGRCYAEGRGVKQDIVMAIDYYRKAAANNSSQAKFCLGQLHEEGRGLEKSSVMAFRYFKEAVRDGHVPSKVKCARFYARGMGGVKRSMPKAVELYRQASAAGDPDAKLSLGLLHEDGHGVKKSSEIALRLYREAAKMGYPPAETALGQCYSWGYGVTNDPGRAVELFLSAADKGNVLAHHELGVCYKDGSGVKKDCGKAAQYFRKAAAKGSAVSFVHYGEMLYSGLGGEQNHQKAFEHFKQAAELGAAEGCRWLGDCYTDGTGTKPNSKLGVAMYRKGSDLGSHEAKTCLGVCYENGTGVEKSKTKALTWYRKAATEGNHTAMNNLGIFYEQGKHVKRDFKRAFQYYQKAIVLGNIDAMCNLADCHKSGNGTPRNLERAVQLYTQAANEGMSGAKCELGICFYEGKGVQQNFGRALELFIEASKSEPEALRQLGIAFCDGKGVKQDFRKAIEYFNKARERDNKDACINLGLCYEKGSGVAQSEQKAVELYKEASDGGSKQAMLILGNCYFHGKGVEQDHKMAMQLFEQGQDDNLLTN